MRDLLEKYAKLIVQMGINVQEGQGVVISIEADQTELAELLVKECYAAGAKKVRVEFGWQAIDKMNMINQDAETLGTLAEWQKAKLQERVDELPALIYIDSADPDGLKGVDPEKMQKVQQMRYPVIKPYRDKMENKYQWCIAAAASRDWAKKVFPEKSEDEAYEALWEAILTSARVTADSDPVKNWEEHNARFHEHCEKLNDMQFDYLHYRSPQGTDLKVWLSDDIIWAGGDEPLGNGVRFNPNIPTEETFTTPIAGKAEGVVYSTKPLSYQGQIIDNFKIRFEDGKAVEWSAEEGEELLGKMLTLDEGAAKLGECALVPHQSPISQSGILFYNTLFDENASCHLAIGAGFTNLVKDYDKYTLEEMYDMGVNKSMTHVDFMIGSAELDIDGYTRDGECVPVFRDGNWAI